jgi:SAM-dependent methyltransferase
MFTPKRRRGVELIDDPTMDAATITRSLGDVARSNLLFGGRRAVLRALARWLPSLGDAAVLLDVGTGIGDIPAAARPFAARRHVALTTIGVDLSPPLVAAARSRIGLAVCADAFALPFADASVDVVTCSQLLHHFVEADATRLLREMARVARVGVIVSDLRRSWLAAGLFWLVSFPLGFHPVTRHDGTLSVMRGFTARELRALLGAAGDGSSSDAAGESHVRRSLGWRLTASWRRPQVPRSFSAHAPTR